MLHAHDISFKLMCEMILRHMFWTIKFCQNKFIFLNFNKVDVVDLSSVHAHIYVCVLDLDLWNSHVALRLAKIYHMSLFAWSAFKSLFEGDLEILSESDHCS